MTKSNDVKIIALSGDDKKIKPSELTKIVTDYATQKPVMSAAKKIVDLCNKRFKEDGRKVFVTTKYTIVRKETNRKSFNKDAFIAVYGEAEYEKFNLPGIAVEYVVTENK